MTPVTLHPHNGRPTHDRRRDRQGDEHQRRDRGLPAGLRSGPGKAFYTDALGFELTRDDDSVPGIGWVTMPPALCKGWFYAPMTSTRLPAAACRRRAVRRTQGSPGPPGRHPRPRRQHDRPAAGPTKSPGETRRTGRPDTSAPDPPRPLRQQTECITIHSVWHRLPCRPNGLARRTADQCALSSSRTDYGW